ncbi:MAG: sulfatase [Verrucomicrobia bacterium]|nr:sulfatase [Verrucomicrobiota bacterium]
MPRPNILWIVTTQWRASAFGHAGDPNARTPCLDAFAAESVNFTQAVTPHPFGPFARAAMLTGVTSPENGVRDYFDPLPLDSRTIAGAMKSLGYATAFFGKWHLGKRDAAAPLVGEAHAKTLVPPGARGGFDHWEGFEGGFLLNDPWLHGTALPVPVQVRGYQSDVLADRAARWLAGDEARDSRPRFCVVSLEAPHPPYDAPAAGVTARDPAAIVLAPNVPLGGPAEKTARKELAGYHAHIEATDRAIGRMLRNLSSETAGPTIVGFTSVHGDMHGAHGLFRKGWPYEESVRVPLLVRRPGVQPRKDDAAVSLLDLPAMTAAWSGGAEWIPGRAGAARISMPSVVALPHQCDRVWHGVRTRDRKLILNDDGTPWLFFDLERDPWEMTNLVGNPASRAEIDRLRTVLLS